MTVYGIRRVIKNNVPFEFRDSKEVKRYVDLFHSNIVEEILGGFLFKTKMQAIKYLQDNFDIKKKCRDMFMDDENRKYYIIEYELE